jgi:glycerophosphoryl diester phosphodiesterase
MPARLDPTFLRPIAHRGLHDAGRGVIENTAPAFIAAIAGGYGIECDLRPAAGGEPVVFHDATLDRLIDGSGPVAALTAVDLERCTYRGSGEHILSFGQFLDLVNGAVPLLVEVKSEWEQPQLAFLRLIAEHARAYRGPLALMSFDPAVLMVLKELAPGIPRGLISGSYVALDGSQWWAEKLTPARAASLRDMTEFDAVEASLAAYLVSVLPAPQTDALRRRGIPVFTWTVRTPAERALAAAHADAMIFEGFTP